MLCGLYLLGGGVCLDTGCGVDGWSHLVVGWGGGCGLYLLGGGVCLDTGCGVDGWSHLVVGWGGGCGLYLLGGGVCLDTGCGVDGCGCCGGLVTPGCGLGSRLVYTYLVVVSVLTQVAVWTVAVAVVGWSHQVVGWAVGWSAVRRAWVSSREPGWAWYTVSSYSIGPGG